MVTGVIWVRSYNYTVTEQSRSLSNTTVCALIVSRHFLPINIVNKWYEGALINFIVFEGMPEGGRLQLRHHSLRDPRQEGAFRRDRALQVLRHPPPSTFHDWVRSYNNIMCRLGNEVGFCKRV